MHISAQADGDMLVLQVRDTGAGFDVANTPEGFGVTQVRERIATRYGNQATMNLVAACASFTWARGQKDTQNRLFEAISVDAAHNSPHNSPHNTAHNTTHGTTATVRLPISLAHPA